MKGKYQSVKGWTFNNLTYKASPREHWKGNPLGNTGSWTSKDGRKWKTECDNATTGANGCRSYIWSNVIEKNNKGAFIKVDKWVFNNMVKFTTPVSLDVKPGKKTPAVFAKDLAPAAQENQRRTGIPASVTIGMAALETGWGGAKMAQPPINTFFNIKCGRATSYSNGCVTVVSAEYKPDGTKYFVPSSFRTYANISNSVLDFGHLLTTLPRYSPAFKYKDNPNQFVTEVRKSGYATDPAYSEMVIGIMKKYNLYQYDL